MKRVLFFVFFFVWSSAFAQAPASSSGRLSMVFDAVPLRQLVLIQYDECNKRGLVFDPSVPAGDAVTIKVQGLTCPQLVSLVSDLMGRAGWQTEPRSTYDLVSLKVRDDREGWRQFIYRPRFRDAIDLADLVQIAVRRGGFAHRRQVALSSPLPAGSQAVPDSGSNGASISGKFVDVLLFHGPAAEADAVESLLSRLDVPSAQVELRAAVIEFRSGASQAFGFGVAASLFGGRLSGAAGSAGAGSALKLDVGSFQAALSLLDQDSRFRFVSRPAVLVRDGQPVRFFAGEDRRVAGAIVLDRNGNPIQSKENLSAGVLLEASPRVRGETVELSLRQVVSTFTGGADLSLLKRELSSGLQMKPGAVYLVGGLQGQQRNDSTDRFLGFRTGRAADVQETELLLLLTVSPDQTAW